MSPLVKFQDSAGPMCRVPVEDMIRVLNIIAGFDAKDPFTSTAVISGKLLSKDEVSIDAFKECRVGVLHQVLENIENKSANSVGLVIQQAIEDIVSLGATVIDIEIPNLEHYLDLSFFM